MSKLRVLCWLSAGLAAGWLVVLAGYQGPALAMSAQAAFAIAFLIVSAQIVLVSWVTPALRGRWLAGCLLFALGVLSLLAGARLTPWSAGMATATLLWTATSLGAGLGTRIAKPGHLAAVAAVSAMTDLWSVYDPTGPSATLAKSVADHPDRVTAFALCFPLLGTPHIPAIIGAGDIVFCALYLAAFEKHRLAVRRAVLGLSLAFVVALILLLVFERALPLLPLLGAAVVLADSRTRSLEGSEKRTVLVVVALVSALLIARLAH